MKKVLVSLLVGGLLGLVAGFAAGIFVYPHVFLSDIVADERVVDRANKRVIATGEFIHVNRSDPIHYGSGSVTAYEDLVHLEPDFEVGPGPKFHVYLVPEQEVRSA
jgi:hypothetical protein